MGEVGGVNDEVEWKKMFQRSSLLAQKSQPYGTANRRHKRRATLVEQGMQRLMPNHAQGT